MSLLSAYADSTAIVGERRHHLICRRTPTITERTEFAVRIISVDDVAGVVRGARRDRGWTQAELASRAGVSRDWVNRLERGSGRVEIAKLLEVFAALGLATTVDDRVSPVDLTAIVRAHENES